MLFPVDVKGFEEMLEECKLVIIWKVIQRSLLTGACESDIWNCLVR